MFIVTPIVGVSGCSMFCCTLLYVHSSITIILVGKRELVALLNLSSWCLVMAKPLFLAVPRVVCGLWLWYFLIILTYYFYCKILIIWTYMFVPKSDSSRLMQSNVGLHCLWIMRLGGFYCKIAKFNEFCSFHTFILRDTTAICGTIKFI